MRDPSHVEEGLKEISKAISSAKEAVDILNNHRKLRENSNFRKQSITDGESGCDGL